MERKLLISFIINAIIFLSLLNLSFSKEQQKQNVLKFNVESSTKLKFNLPDVKNPYLKKLTLYNAGNKNINDFYFLFNDSLNLSNIQNVSDFIIANNKKDDQKIKSAVDFFDKYIRFQDKESLPLSETDPIKMLNIYGEGNSKDISLAFTAICKYLGFKYRIWDLKEYAVPEVFYDNKWHFFDVANNNYIEDKKGNILSIRETYDLSTSPTLININGIKANKRDALPQTIDFVKKNISSKFIYEAAPINYTCNWKLDIGDKIFFSKQESGEKTQEIFCSYICQPNLSSKDVFDKFLKSENLSNFEYDKIKTPILHLKNGYKKGMAEMKIEFPYLIKTAEIEIEPILKKSGNISISVSKDKNLWETLLVLNKNSDTKKISLGQAYQGTYQYFVRLEFAQEKDLEAGLNSIKFINYFGFNPILFPQLKKGENSLDIQLGDKYSINNKLEIEIEYGLE